MYGVDAKLLDCSRDLLPFLNDSCKSVRSSIAANIGRLGNRASGAISALEKMALNESEADAVRENAIYSLARIGKEAMPSIRRIVARNSDFLSRRVSRSLSPMGELGEEAAEAIDILLQFVKSSDRDTRWSAIEALKQFAKTAPKYFQRKALDPSADVAVPAILAVSYVNKNRSTYSERIVAELQRAKEDGQLESAIIALGYAKVDLSREVIAVLSRAIVSKSKDVRFAAVDAICARYLDDPVLREKTEVAAADEWPVSSRAIQALCLRGHYSDRFFRLTLENASSADVDPDVRRFSILALGNMGANGAPALNVLRKLRDNPEVLV